jgi:hypothetical protein
MERILLMFFDKNLKIFIFFIITLIVSITPTSAELMGEEYRNSTNVISKDVGLDEKLENETLKNLETDLIEVKKPLDAINEDMWYITKRSKDYNWRMWIWPKITIDIIYKIGTLLVNLPNLESPIVKLDDDSVRLQKLTNTPKAEANSGKDADNMANALSKYFNTGVTVETVKASELKEGDIVQYMSQGKYPRYLQVVNIINKTNTIKQNKTIIQETPTTFVPLLKGSGNWEVMAQASLKKLNFDKQIIPDDIVCQAASIQKSNTEQPEEKIFYYTSMAELFKDLGTVLAKTTGALFAIGFIGVLMAPVTGGVSLALTVCDVFCVFTAIGSSICFIIYAIYYDLANNLKKNMKPSQADLNRYTEILPETNMNLTTYDGISIVKQPPIADWKEYEFLLIKNPQHGDVLSGPGIQFLFGPNEGYTGTDNFKFLYSDNGKPIGIINVDIDIDPIPRFNNTGGMI